MGLLGWKGGLDIQQPTRQRSMMRQELSPDSQGRISERQRTEPPLEAVLELGTTGIQMQSQSFSLRGSIRLNLQSHQFSAGSTAYDPYDAFQDWLASILGEGYQYSRGMWVDHPSLDSAFIAAIQQTGGPRLRSKFVACGSR